MKLKDEYKFQPGSMNCSGYCTQNRPIQYAIRRILGGNDSKKNRDIMSDFFDRSGSDPLVKEAMKRGHHMMFTVILEDGSTFLFTLSSVHAALDEFDTLVLADIGGAPCN